MSILDKYLEELKTEPLTKNGGAQQGVVARLSILDLHRPTKGAPTSGFRMGTLPACTDSLLHSLLRFI